MKVTLTRRISRVDGIVRRLIATVIKPEIERTMSRLMAGWNLVADMTIEMPADPVCTDEFFAYVFGHLDDSRADFRLRLHMVHMCHDIWNVDHVKWTVEVEDLNRIKCHGECDITLQPWDCHPDNVKIITPDFVWSDAWEKMMAGYA